MPSGRWNWVLWIENSVSIEGEVLRLLWRSIILVLSCISPTFWCNYLAYIRLILIYGLMICSCLMVLSMFCLVSCKLELFLAQCSLLLVFWSRIVWIWIKDILCFCYVVLRSMCDVHLSTWWERTDLCLVSSWLRVKRLVWYLPTARLKLLQLDASFHKVTYFVLLLINLHICKCIWVLRYFNTWKLLLRRLSVCKNSIYLFG